jgi:hypothetical protein
MQDKASQSRPSCPHLLRVFTSCNLETGFGIVKAWIPAFAGMTGELKFLYSERFSHQKSNAFPAEPQSIGQ